MLQNGLLELLLFSEKLSNSLFDLLKEDVNSSKFGKDELTLVFINNQLV